MTTEKKFLNSTGVGHLWDKIEEKYINSEELELVINAIDETKADKTEVLLKAEQELTDNELDQVRKNLRFIGKDVEGKEFTINGETLVASPNTEIFGDYENNIAIGQWSIVEGSTNVATGRVCHVEGAQNQALNDGCHVEGVNCIASGYWSHAEGEMTRVTSYASHAEGSYTKMPDGTTRYGTASGYASHVEGGGSYAQGSCSHAEGLATTAKGGYSHTEGKYTIAGSDNQHVEGIANIEDTENKYIHIAGNGSFETRSNAYTLDWDGNGWFSGEVYIGSENGFEKDAGSKKLATEEYIDTNIINLTSSIKTKKEKDIIVTYKEDSDQQVTHQVSEILEATNNGITVKFQKDAELLELLEVSKDFATFYIVYINQNNKLQQKIISISGDYIIIEQDDTYDYATIASLNNYYTKSEADKKIANLVNSAPETLDTLGELATAFNENKEVVDALNEAIVNKQNKNIIVTKDADDLANYTPAEILTAVQNGINVYYCPNLNAGTLHPYLEGSSTVSFFYSNYIDNNRVVGTGYLINSDKTVTASSYSALDNYYTKSQIDETMAEKYSANNLPPYPVTSVQGQTGNVNFTTETWTFTLTDGTTVTK